MQVCSRKAGVLVEPSADVSLKLIAQAPTEPDASVRRSAVGLGPDRQTESRP